MFVLCFRCILALAGQGVKIRIIHTKDMTYAFTYYHITSTCFVNSQIFISIVVVKEMENTSATSVTP